MTGARSALLALSGPARRAAARLTGIFVLWAVGHELAFGSGFVAAVARPPGMLLLLFAGISAVVAAVGEPLRAERTRGARWARALARAGAGLLHAAPPLSLSLRATRMLRVGEGQDVPAGALPGLPPLAVGEFSLSPRGPIPLSKTVGVPLRTPDGEAEVGLFPPIRLAGWRLVVFQFGYAPAVRWFGPDGRPIAEGFMMLGTFPRTEEEARLVEWLPEPNVMMGVGTFPPKVEDLLTPRGTEYHLHLRLEEATLAGERRKLSDPEGYRFVMDGHPTDPVLTVEVFRRDERIYSGRIPAGGGAEFPGGRLEIGRELRLWADLQAVRDPFVELFLFGALLLSAGALLALTTFTTALVVRR